MQVSHAPALYAPAMRWTAVEGTHPEPRAFHAASVVHLPEVRRALCPLIIPAHDQKKDRIQYRQVPEQRHA